MAFQGWEYYWWISLIYPHLSWGWYELFLVISVFVCSLCLKLWKSCLVHLGHWNLPRCKSLVVVDVFVLFVLKTLESCLVHLGHWKLPRCKSLVVVDVFVLFVLKTLEVMSRASSSPLLLWCGTIYLADSEVKSCCQWHWRLHSWCCMTLLFKQEEFLLMFDSWFWSHVTG